MSDDLQAIRKEIAALRAEITALRAAFSPPATSYPGTWTGTATATGMPCTITGTYTIPPTTGTT